MTIDDLRQLLDERNIKYDIILQDKPILSVADAAMYYPMEKSAPTFVLQTEDELISCITSVQNGRLNFEKLKKQFGFTKLKMADKNIIKLQTGYEIGSIPLVGLKLRCLFDGKLLNHDFVYGGTGNELMTLKIDPKDIMEVNTVIGLFY